MEGEITQKAPGDSAQPLTLAVSPFTSDAMLKSTSSWPLEEPSARGFLAAGALLSRSMSELKGGEKGWGIEVGGPGGVICEKGEA